jgi:hypothetical protein
MFPSRKNARAKIIRRGATPCLLAIFDASTPPMIWQFDLEKMANYSMTLREKDGEWDLGVALPQGTFTVVAHFDERGDAESAYAAVRKAMIKGEKSALRKTIFIALVALGLYFALQLGFSNFWPPAKNENTAPQQTTQEQSAGPQQIQPGVPMTADDVLTVPQD